ncbi:archaeosine synthase subunit alpha [Haloarchaeobius amylolyticus]|uniref:archaeosine synthase subunit alpha n=1 Tax=Haloarchaeobius amylolyticus TaxID=1198296 RepID=UPI00227189A3|nr:archaeosine synthase subunit alpha [Haloarchaeobius amylolyticus]
MTEYFEVHERDGAARRAELRLSEPVTTPALVDDVVADAGSLWPGERELPEGDESTLTILPHRGLPAGTADEVQDSFKVDYPEVDFPSAVVVSTDTAEDHGADVYVLSDAQGSVGHGKGMKDAILAVKDAIPDDTGLYLSGVATPRNVAVLAYAGVDMFDEKQARAKGLKGEYLTTDDRYFLEDLDELPCACPACQTTREEFDRAACAEHNANALAAELSRVRRRIRDGRLRDYVEGQARQDQWLTALFRELDQQYGYLEARTPIYREADLDATTEDTLKRVEIQRFADRVTSRYTNRFDGHPLVLVPCSARKPYSESQSHRQYMEAVNFRGHMVSMTSPIGVVPQELETTYPAQHYDSVVTGSWTAGEREFVSAVLRRYLQRNDYPRVVAHLPEDYRPIVEAVEDDVELDIEYTVEDHPTTSASLSNLRDALDGELKYSKREREHNTVRAIADYQFGDGAGDTVFGDFQTTSRYPKIQVRDPEGTQLATQVPNYGTLSLTLEGAKRWDESDVPTKRVEIDGFVPHGSVLAPGVIDADEDIRVGDEVVIEGPKAFGIGRAQMHGEAMVESTRGEASSVRHVEET